jgi:hypothetical protein
MISFKTPKYHWSYFLAIEKDLENTSRYVEFSTENLETFSIEFTHILLSASSEIDVLLKQICALLDGNSKRENIDNYRDIIIKYCSQLIDEEIIINRYGMTFKPWESWKEGLNPTWWNGYNKVKHKRNDSLSDANLKNAVNAVGALLIVVLYYYKLQYSNELNRNFEMSETTNELQPESFFIEINNDEYY